jgi:site-specific DNA-methyltransferase (adenine-specific)
MEGIVLDPYCGSGSTAIAARLEGRRFVAIEVDKAAAKTAKERLESLDACCLDGV